VPVGLLSIALAAAAVLPPVQTPRFASGVDLVRIDVVVTDRDGRPVAGLTADDFSVEENGKARTIVGFEPVVVRGPGTDATGEPVPPTTAVPQSLAPEAGRSILVFFDDFHVGAIGAERVRASLRPFLERELREGDWLTLVAPSTGLWFTARTVWERRHLPEAIARFKGQFVRQPFKGDPTDWNAMQSVEYGRGEPMSAMFARPVYETARRRIEQTLTALDRALAALAGMRGRKTVIFYSEGFIEAPHMPFYERVIERARRANVAIEWIDPLGLETGMPTAESRTASPASASSNTPGAERDRELAGSRFVAISTGGRESFSNDAVDLARRALAESSCYYLLGYEPTDGPPGERKVRVRVRRTGLSVRSRNRYFAAAPEALATGAAAVREALASLADATGVPLRVSADVSGDSKVTLRLDLAPPAGEPAERTLELVIEGRRIEGGEPVLDIARLILPASRQPLSVTRPLALAPGTWQLRVVVQDAGSGALGSVRQTLEVR